MFKTMLPGPLSSLHFTKVDFGNVPLKTSNVKTTKTNHDGIKLDMNVEWEGKCDLELDGHMVPALVSLPLDVCIQCWRLTYAQGVEGVELYGRLSILLAPITNVIPLVSSSTLIQTVIASRADNAL